VREITASTADRSSALASAGAIAAVDAETGRRTLEFLASRV